MHPVLLHIRKDTLNRVLQYAVIVPFIQVMIFETEQLTVTDIMYSDAFILVK